MHCNLALFAEQGYIVVAPNPTGSTGYGHDFTDAIQGSWAGKPYSDLERGFDYICQSLEYVDTERAEALGLGYGGYMVNWMQGHDLGCKFKALIADNGTFNPALLSSQQHTACNFSWTGWTALVEPRGMEKMGPCTICRELEDATIDHSRRIKSLASCL